MNISCGTDIIEIERIKKSIESTNGRFIKEIYTEKEIEYCESKKRQKYQHYAARFSAKEAVFKALSVILEDKYSISWLDVEIINDENGRPYINFTNKTISIFVIDYLIIRNAKIMSNQFWNTFFKIRSCPTIPSLSIIIIFFIIF